MKQYLLGIDIGTSGTKVLLIDESGKKIASITEEYPLYTPRPMWAEQEPLDWWQATVKGIQKIIAKDGVNSEDIVGIGLSGQMHGSVFLDKDSKIIRPALLWCDQRTVQECDIITERVGRDIVLKETLNPVLTGFTAPKILWLERNEPDNYKKLAKVLLPKDYVRFMLTGEMYGDVSDASGTSLFNVKTRQWSAPMVEATGINIDMLTPVLESCEVCGYITADIAKLTGLKEGTPVVAGGGDNAAGAVGNGIVREGIASCSIGTSGVFFAHLKKLLVDTNGYRTHTFCAAVPNEWHVMGVQLSSGGSFRWFRDTLCREETEKAKELGIDPYELMTKSAEEVNAGCEGLFFLPYLTGERCPYQDPYASGAFFGLTLRHAKPHLTRAVMEGVTYGLRDALEIFHEMGTSPSEIRLTGGGGKSPLWRQIQADIYNSRCVTVSQDEGPGFGAALLAGVGVKVYNSVPDACEKTVEIGNETLPTADQEIYSKYYPLFKKLYAANKDIFKMIAGI